MTTNNHAGTIRLGGRCEKHLSAKPCSQCADAVGVPKDREADRARFSDPAFNYWLDEGISDAGHTVWDQIGDVCAAWHGWENRGFYTAPGDDSALDAIELICLNLIKQAGMKSILEFVSYLKASQPVSAAVPVVDLKPVERAVFWMEMEKWDWNSDASNDNRRAAYLGLKSMLLSPASCPAAD